MDETTAAAGLSHEVKVYLSVMAALAGALVGFMLAIWCDSRERRRQIEEERKRVEKALGKRT